jgi:hypothetical protein
VLAGALWLKASCTSRFFFRARGGLGRVEEFAPPIFIMPVGTLGFLGWTLIAFIEKVLPLVIDAASEFFKESWDMDLGGCCAVFLWARMRDWSLALTFMSPFAIWQKPLTSPPRSISLPSLDWRMMRGLLGEMLEAGRTSFLFRVLFLFGKAFLRSSWFLERCYEGDWFPS